MILSPYPPHYARRQCASDTFSSFYLDGHVIFMFPDPKGYRATFFSPDTHHVHIHTRYYFRIWQKSFLPCTLNIQSIYFETNKLYYNIMQLKISWILSYIFFHWAVRNLFLLTIDQKIRQLYTFTFDLEVSFLTDIFIRIMPAVFLGVCVYLLVKMSVLDVISSCNAGIY